MSHTCEGDQGRGESPNRMRAELQVGPSTSPPSRQGYCGYCRVLYRDLDQHLASLKHLDSVNTSCQGSGPASTSTSTSGRARQTLMERFLHDVLQHHPHHYQDNRPSHADLPCLSTPPVPRKELGEAGVSDDAHLAGSCERLSDNNPDIAHKPPAPSAPAEVIPEWPAGPRRAAERGARTSWPHQGRPTSHRKAHRKTNRRKSSSDDSPPRMGPECDPESLAELRRSSPRGDTESPSCLRPWGSQREERGEAPQERLPSDQGHLLDQTIEEVIQECCHGGSSSSCHEEMFVFSLPVSMETQSEDRNSAEQVVSQTPVQARQLEEQHVSRLMEVQVDLEDQTYAHQLDCALRGQRRAGDGGRLAGGFRSLPIEEVLPAPEHIPESFRGKTWAQIEQEDEEKVEKLVKQFRKEKFVCYFDSESLARFGRRRHGKEKHYEMVVLSDSRVLPLLDCQHDGSERVQRQRQVFKVASRCQVVKVSHSTQTVQLVAPAVRQSGAEAPPTSICAANPDVEERTPPRRTRQCLPRSYSKVMTPLQPDTSLVYLLCAPSASGSAAALSPRPKRCRKKKRPLNLQGLKVTYKHLPLQFYEPSSNRILKVPPEGSLPHQGSTSSSVPPSCVRQLFRSLSPDLNADSRSFLLNALRRDAPHTDAARGQHRAAHSRSERGRGFRKAKTCLPTTRASAEAPPTQGLQRTGPSRKVLRSGCSRPSAPFKQRASTRGRKRRQR